ncbi:MAG: hypothetical protein FJ387_01755 [Verrucomicrobia bacterium]|nr:hypothetical protein [Verrucomicrobiota bacterium]
MLTETFLTYGQPEPPSCLAPLRAGPLTMLYDPSTGFVRRIKLGEREVLRGIYAAVRDRNWGTPPGVVRETLRDVKAQSFRIEFESVHRQGDIHFVWHGSLCGAADGTLRYDFDGAAKTAFLRNRIGFCVLHPIRECAGAPARQRRADGRAVAGRFPESINPQIIGRGSFQDLAGLAHEVGGGLWAELEFEGDVFEMEDQRNWTDASFKTYCTPLGLAFPVAIAEGSRIRQAVTLRLAGATQVPTSGGEVVSQPSGMLTLEIPEAPTTRLPAVGLGIASHGEPLDPHEVSALSELGPAHLRLDLRLATTSWPTRLEQAAAEAEQMGARLELAVHLPRQGEVEADNVARAMGRHASSLARVLALREGEAATSPATLLRVRALLRGADVPVGAGSDCNFCELNREQGLGRLAAKEADFLFWSINPQVHASDHLSVMETLEAQAATARSARAFARGRPLAVTPVTLKQRFNPVATGPAPAPASGELPPQVDPRQLSHFGAAWTLGSLVAWATAEVESVTWYETTGWRGVMERVTGSPLPNQFPSTAGGVFPLFHVLASLSGRKRWAGVAAIQLAELAGLALFDSHQALQRVLLANLSAGVQQVRIAGPFTASGLERSPATPAGGGAWHIEAPPAFAGGSCQKVSGVIEAALPPYAFVQFSRRS